jgi:hypothetical protein
MRKLVAPISAIAVVLVAGGATAQVLYTLVSPKDQLAGWFGFSVSGAGNVDLDDYNDLIVGAPGEDADSAGAGRAYIFTGGTGALVHSLVSPNQRSEGEFGTSVSGAGYTDSDWFADVIVGAPSESVNGDPWRAGRAYIFGGETGVVLHELESPNPEYAGKFGYCVSGAGDTNNDGYDDVIVGAYLEDPGGSPLDAGRAYLFSGLTGDTLRTLTAPFEMVNAWFGKAVAGIGDVNSDGFDDVVVGAPLTNSPSQFEFGAAYIFSGRNGNLLHPMTAPMAEEFDRFGWSVSGVGDVNIDGIPDVAVGAVWKRSGSSPDSAGKAYVFSGTGGPPIYTLVSPNEQAGGHFGHSVSGAGDVDNDGCPDVVVGAPGEYSGASPWWAGRAYVFSGATGTALATLVSPNEQLGGVFGTSVSGAGNLDNAGNDDVIVGAYREYPGASPLYAGRAYVFPFPPPIVLSGHLTGGQLQLTWTECWGAEEYWIYGADNLAYFPPGLVPPYTHRLAIRPWWISTWFTPAGIGDPDHNWTYMVIGVDASSLEIDRSNRWGEHDFSTVTPP